MIRIASSADQASAQKTSSNNKQLCSEKPSPNETSNWCMAVRPLGLCDIFFFANFGF
jgi:hypothetical protein